MQRQRQHQQAMGMMTTTTIAQCSPCPCRLFTSRVNIASSHRHCLARSVRLAHCQGIKPDDARGPLTPAPPRGHCSCLLLLPLLSSSRHHLPTSTSTLPSSPHRGGGARPPTPGTSKRQLTQRCRARIPIGRPAHSCPLDPVVCCSSFCSYSLTALIIRDGICWESTAEAGLEDDGWWGIVGERHCLPHCPSQRNMLGEHGRGGVRRQWLVGD
jgi:hypothetical protein